MNTHSDIYYICTQSHKFFIIHDVLLHTYTESQIFYFVPNVFIIHDVMVNHCNMLLNILLYVI